MKTGTSNVSGTGVSWGNVLMIWAAGLGAAAQYGKISVTFDRLPELYPDVGAAMGLTVSMVGLVGIVVGVVAGLFVSAFGYRRSLFWALFLGAGCSAVQALHLPFGLFLLTRFIEGISHVGIVVAGPTLMSLLASGPARGFVMTLWGTFFGVSFAIISWLGLPVVDYGGVSALFAVHAAIMAVLAVAARASLGDLPLPERAPFPAMRALPAMHWRIYRSPEMLAPAAGWVFYTCCFVATLTLLPRFLADEIRAPVMGAMPLVSIIVSMTLGVLMLRYISAVRLVQLGFACGAGCYLWLLLAPGSALAALVLAGAMGLVQGGSFAAVPELNVSAADRSSANGAMSQAGNLGNAVGTPLLLAMIAMGGYEAMIIVSAILMFMGAVAHQFLSVLRR